MLRIQKALAAYRDRLAEKKEGDEGFTLIELLIVVLIIGVLAAIAIPIYISATSGAADNTARTNVQSAVTAVGVYATAHSGDLPASLADTDFPNPTSGAGVVTYQLTADGDGFCVQATGNGTNTFAASDEVGVTAGTCVDGAVVAAAGPTGT